MDQPSQKNIIKLEDIESVYLKYRQEYLNWTRKWIKLSEEDRMDCWQDAVIDCYEQCRDGKLKSLDVKLKTYLFAVAKNKLLSLSKKKNLRVEKNQAYLEIAAYRSEPEADESSMEKIKLLKEEILKLSPKNRDVLIARYYHRKGLDEIQEEFNYKNRNALSAALSRALSTLQKAVKSNIFSLMLMFYLLNQLIVGNG